MLTDRQDSTGKDLTAAKALMFKTSFWENIWCMSNAYSPSPENMYWHTSYTLFTSEYEGTYRAHIYHIHTEWFAKPR
jgi:hypothetical protein